MRLTEALDSVRGEEEHALVVLEQSEEDTHHGIPLHVILGTLLQDCCERRLGYVVARARKNL